MSNAWYRSACPTNIPHARAFRTTVGSGGTIETSERDHHGRNIRSEKGRQVRAHHEGQAAATSAARRQQEVIRRNCPRASVFSSHVGSSVCRSATDLNQPERSGGAYRRRTVSAITPTSPVRGRRGRWRTPWARAVTPSGMFGPSNSRANRRRRSSIGHTRADTEGGQSECSGRCGADRDGLQHFATPIDLQNPGLWIAPSVQSRRKCSISTSTKYVRSAY